MEKNKKILLLVLVAAVVGIVGMGAYFYMSKFFKALPVTKKSASTVMYSLQESKEIDKFYTGIYLIPVIDVERGVLKREMATKKLKSVMNIFVDTAPAAEASPVIKGYCLKKYEVAFGYDNLMRILENQDYLQAASKGNLAALPSPQILAVNCQSTETQGKYDSTGICYEWDSDAAKRKTIILRAMEEEKILQKVIQRGRESLANLLSAFCS